MINYWGPKAWKLIHCVAQNYPNEPTIIDKQYYTNFYHTIPYILPCKKCQYHFLKQLRNNPINNHLNSKKSLCAWLYKLHNNVNLSNNKPIYTFQQANKLYKSKLYIDDINKFLVFLRQNVQYGHLNMKTYNIFMMYFNKVLPISPIYSNRIVKYHYR